MAAPNGQSMELRRSAPLLLLVVFFTFTLTATAQTGARIRQAIDSRQMTTLADHVHPLAQPDFDQGAIDPSQMLHRVVISFTRTPAQQQALDRLIEEQQDPSSTNYHRWLTPEEFADRFGLPEADVARIRNWLTEQGFTIDEISRARTYIAFSGPAGYINSALRTELHQYAMNGEIHFANANSPSVPSAMANVVAGIRSLNDFRLKPRVRQRRVKPDFTSSLSGNHYMSPDDFATIYNINALYQSGIDGTGQKVAVMGQTDIVLSDVTTFRSVSNLPPNAPQVVLVPGSADPGIISGDITEASLDVQWAGAVARNAKIIYVNSKNGVFDSLQYAINSNIAPVISISYGLCEAFEQSTGGLPGDQNMLIQASAQGQTVVTPAGDSGATDCDSGVTATHGLAVDFPASSPNVVAIGGTTFNEGAGNYWNTVNNIYQGSAFFYVPEVVWNDSDSSGLSATGGGVSILFTKPSFQAAPGVPNDGFRDVPDVSFAASPAHDGYIICVQGDCQICVTSDANCPSASSPGYRKISDQTLDIIGGTSAGVPAFAGVLGLLNHKMGTPQGNINYRLYPLASSAPYVFHDITSGNNNSACNAGTKDCPSGGSIGYSAGPGYDLATGLGTVDVYNLVTNWNDTPAADFGISFFNPSQAVTKGSSANILVTVRSQNGFSGTVNLSCASNISGVTCSVSPSTVNPDQAATVTIVAAANAGAQSTSPSRPIAWLWMSGFGVAGLFTMGAGRRRKRQAVVVISLLVVIAASFVSCGGAGAGFVSSQGSGSSTASATQVHERSAVGAANAPQSSITPTRPSRGSRAPVAGITITGTSGNTTRTAQLPVTLN